jgi:hypothetical protein
VPTLVFIDDDSKRNITSLVIIVLTVGWIATRVGHQLLKLRMTKLITVSFVLRSHQIGMRIRQRRGAGSESFSYAAVTTEDEPAAGDLDEDTITATF